MPTLEVKNISGKKVGSVELDDSIFDAEINEHLLWEAVKWQRAKKRAGTHSTKTRGEVKGTKAKPYKQKGTGRARHGSRRSPIWVGGGIVFGPRPRSYEYTMPKKAKRAALRSALSVRAGEAKVVVVDAFPVKDGKTRAVAAALGKLGAEQPASKVLIVDTAENHDLSRGSRNLASSKWLPPEGVNVYDILDHDTLVITQDAVTALEERLR